MGRYPVFWRRILVGVCWGRNNRVFSALFIMVCSCWSSILEGSHPSAPYVSMGMIIESTSCHTASIFIPLSSLFPVSVIMFCVAAWTFFSSSFICVDRFPLLFIISPRYLYASTSSNVCPFRVSLLLGPFPILTTLHLAAPNSMWYFFATWFVISSICWSLSLGWPLIHVSDWWTAGYVN